jgi:hypothetical protein
MLGKIGMKSLPKLLIALAAAAAFSIVQPVKANLITNPGFETGDFTGWTAVGPPLGVTGTLDGIAPHSGNPKSYGAATASALGLPWYCSSLAR